MSSRPTNTRRDLQERSNDNTDQTSSSDLGSAERSSAVVGRRGGRGNGRCCRSDRARGGGSDLGHSGASNRVARGRVEGGGSGDGPLDGDGLVEDGGGSGGACSALSNGQQGQKRQREYRRDLHLDRNTGSLG